MMRVMLAVKTTNYWFTTAQATTMLVPAHHDGNFHAIAVRH